MDTNLIVATWHNLIVLRNGEVLEHLSEPNIGHYGVTWNDKYLFALFAATDVLDGTKQAIRLFDKSLKPVKDILYGDIAGVHQIQWHDGALWITSTNDDTIVITDENGNIRKRWRPIVDYDPGESGKHHVNSLWFNGNGLYLLAHGLTNGKPGIYRYNYPGLDLDWVIPAPRKCHNIYLHVDHLVTYWHNWLLSIDGSKDNEARKIGAEDNWMMRGLAVTNDNIYVGAARIIEDRATRRQDKLGRVYRLDHSYRQLNTWDLNLGPVGEIRALNKPDRAHHGMLWLGKYGRNND